MRSLALCLLVTACSRPQWLVVAMTNALTPTWGDHVLIEVLDDNGALACGDCRAEFPVTDASFPLSFGVAQKDGVLRVRGRLYRASQVGADGKPQGSALIDVVGVLPSLNAITSDTRVVLPLFAACWGVPANLEQHTSCNLTKDKFGNYVLVSNPEQLLKDTDIESSPLQPGHILPTLASCEKDAPSVPAEMVCLEAQTFLLGSSRSAGVEGDYPPVPELLRQPQMAFLLDQDEMTVGEVRKLGLTFQPDELGRSGVCTWRDDGSQDDWPLNCISRTAAVRVCDALDKHLPDEGQWEAAARNLAASTRYPWGEAPPGCDDAWVSVDDSCRRSGPGVGSLHDQTQLGVRNLGGNLSEWVEGILVPYDHDCWQPLPDPDNPPISAGADALGAATYDAGCVYHDAALTWGGPWPVRGGSWDRGRTSAAGFARFASVDGAASPSIGFRCARTAPDCRELCVRYNACQTGATSLPACEASCLELFHYTDAAAPDFPYGRVALDLLQISSQLDCLSLLDENLSLLKLGFPGLRSK